jgi:hypothetical protein
MDELMISVAENTFPIAVAVFLLIRMEKRLDDLTSAIVRLETAICGIAPVCQLKAGALDSIETGKIHDK